MKKTLFSAALVAAFGLVAIQAHAAAGTINFTGQVTDVSCTVTPGAGTTGTAGNFTVALAPTPATNLVNDGDRAMDTPFALVVGGSGQSGCTNGKIASLVFEPAQNGANIDATTGRLVNTGTATKVEIGLLNDTKKIINLATGTNNTTATIANNTATLNYYAQYVATGGSATVGTVNANLVYSVAYN